MTMLLLYIIIGMLLHALGKCHICYLFVCMCGKVIIKVPSCMICFDITCMNSSKLVEAIE